MFPNYRTSARQRREKLAMGCMIAGAGLVALFAIGLWVAVGYIGFHFVGKYW